MALEVTVKRELRQEDVRCWAAELLGPSAVRCAVEGNVIDGYQSPDTITAFCCGEPESCPSWREEVRVRSEKHSTVARELERQRTTARQRRDVARELRAQAAEALLRGDTEEALKFRARIRHYMRGGSLTDRRVA